MGNEIEPTNNQTSAEWNEPEKTPQESMQDGVRVAEAVTHSWSKKSLAIIYICMWSLYFVQALQSSLTANLSPYITSDFEAHSLITVIGIMTNIMSAACTMPVAKILNLWDRTVGFGLMVLLSLLGLILMASCNSLAVYCAAQVFYYVGFTGMIFAVDVLTSDTSSIRNRGLAFAFTSSPYIVTAFAGAPLSERFHASNWRWAYGTICILLPVVVAPLAVTWEMAKRKATKNQVLEKTQSCRTWTQSAWYYIIEFDVIGILLLVAGASLLLLPFSLADSQAKQWRATHIIVMFVLGGVFCIVFGAYERFLAPKPFIPYHLLTNRTVVGACLLDITYQIAYYAWNPYFTSYLRVVYNTSMTQAGYIAAIFDLVSATSLLGVGYLMRATRRFKWILMCSVPLYMLAVGLMIYFRAPHHSVGFICMCEVLIGLGGGTIILIEQTVVVTASSHEHYAAMLALLTVFGNIGGAVGNAVAGAVWTNILPYKMREFLPGATKGQWEDIYNDIKKQLSYDLGSPTREAIIAAYAVTQKYMLIAGTAIMALTIAWVLMMKNIKLEDRNNFRGMVF